MHTHSSAISTNQPGCLVHPQPSLACVPLLCGVQAASNGRSSESQTDDASLARRAGQCDARTDGGRRRTPLALTVCEVEDGSQLVSAARHRGPSVQQQTSRVAASLRVWNTAATVPQEKMYAYLRRFHTLRQKHSRKKKPHVPVATAPYRLHRVHRLHKPSQSEKATLAKVRLGHPPRQTVRYVFPFSASCLQESKQTHAVSKQY